MTSARPRWPILAGFWVAALVVVTSVLLTRLPAPEDWLKDPDWGHQLAGAQAIHEGRIPFVDFNATYGPLCFYATAAAQALGNGRPDAEILLCVAGYALGYLALFALAWKISGQPLLALAVLFVGMGAAPRLYKYYLLLGPALSALLAVLYVAKPGRLRLLSLASAIVLTGLYRADFGAYAVLIGLLAVTISHEGSARWKELAVAIGLILAAALPWLAWVTWNGGLMNYLACSTIESARHAHGLSLPLPRDPHGIFGINPLFLLAPLLPLVATLAAWKWRAADSRARRALVVLMAFAWLQLIQAGHRSDVGHLMQATSLQLVFLTLLLALAVEAIRAKRLVAGGALLLGPVLVVLAAGANELRAPRLTPELVRAGLARLDRFHQPVSAMSRECQNLLPDDPYFQLLGTIETRTRPGERIFVLPYALGLYYASGHPFAGTQMGMTPGYFTTPDREQAFAASLEKNPPALIVDAPDFSFDGLPERHWRRFSPAVAAFIDRHYVPAERFGPYVLLQPATPGRAATVPE